MIMIIIALMRIKIIMAIMNDPHRPPPHHRHRPQVQFVIDAVYAFAFALQKMKNKLCPRHKGAK